MSHDVTRFSCDAGYNPCIQTDSINAFFRPINAVFLLLIVFIFQIMGCVSDKVDIDSNLLLYQQSLSDQGPQRRADTEGNDPNRPLDLLRPVPPQSEVTGNDNKVQESHGDAKEVPFPGKIVPNAAAVIDPNSGQKAVLGSGLTPSKKIEPIPPAAKGARTVSDANTPEETKVINLTIEQAIKMTLANSPEIRVVSFDPSIAKQDVTKAASEFDMTAFWSLNYDNEDNPPNSIFQPGESEVQTWDTGVKQKGLTGLEWSLSYGLTRSWDDLVGRTLPTRYEPMLSFQIKQPLLRDAGENVTLSGVNIAKLNYKTAFLGFRDKAEDTATKVIAAYWQLLQARRDVEIQQALLDRTLDTLSKVQGRKQIDATAVQIKQTEASMKAREATLLQAEKAVSDAQDVLVRLIADPQLNVLGNFQIVPATKASLDTNPIDQSKILELAMDRNPTIQQARLAIEIANINIHAAENRRMPRLDLVASARGQGLARGRIAAQGVLENGDYVSYAVGLSLEIPLGNRQREAELLKRKLERRQAIASLQNVADQVAIAAKEARRKIETNHSEIQVQKDAVEAASIQLQALEDSEPVREQLTPEFLLVKLQGQEALANAQKSEIRAIVEFNISLVQLARILGTVFELHQVTTSLPTPTEKTISPRKSHDNFNKFYYHVNF